MVPSSVKTFINKINAVVGAILEFGKINILVSTTIWVASKMLTKKVGESLAKFVEALVKPLAKYDSKTLKGAADTIKAVGKMLLYISSAIAILTLLVALDLKSTLIAAGIVLGVIVILLGLSQLIALIPAKWLAKGIEGLESVAKAALWASLSIGIIALLSAIFGLDTVLTSAEIVVGIISILLGMA